MYIRLKMANCFKKNNKQDEKECVDVYLDLILKPSPETTNRLFENLTHNEKKSQSA